MLHLYQSNLTECLLAGLNDVLSQRTDAMPLFEAEHILVQNPDMAQWLKMELASVQGIAANLKFPLPSSFLWTIFHCLFQGELPEQSPYSKDKLVWQLMLVLPDFANDTDFKWLHEYLVDVTEPEPQFRLFQLCTSIADTFDQYLMYRPDWIAQWEQGEGFEAITAEQRWQAKLWQALAQVIVLKSGCAMHRGRLLAQTIERLNQEQALALAGLPRRICIFGMSSMPEQTLLLLNALAQHIEVHWFQLNPCAEFWLDIVDERSKAKLAAQARYHHLDDLEASRYFLVGNPLLASMGQLGREHLSLMYEQLECDLLEDYQPYPNTGALGLLQNEVLHLTCRGQFESFTPQQLASNEGKRSLLAAELSNLQFHVCYSPLREVEALRDQLLRQFEQDPSLRPNDVLIMMPDVGSYAPFIEAVFSAGSGSTYLPYSINDLSAIEESPLLDSFMKLLDLPDSRFLFSEIVSLLEVPAVMRRFALDSDELLRLKSWLHGAGVRWGRDGQQRAALGVGEYEENSWQFGLRRMLMGYAMHSSQGLFQGILPFDEVEGHNAATLGKLIQFIEALDLGQDALSQMHTGDQWADTLASLITLFYEPDTQEQIELQQIHDALAGLALSVSESEFKTPLGRPLVRDHLKQRLHQTKSGRRFRAGAINFCTLMPMRNIPFKVVCLLGMSEGMFPRSSVPVNFDLMQGQRRRGDRSRRLDDRYLFLEAILACRSHLHMSWVGRDIRDDNELPPSLLISEVRDYLADALLIQGDETLAASEAAKRVLAAMTYHHPLQAFHPRYFVEGPMQSYDPVWAACLQKKPAIEPFAARPLSAALEPEHWVELRQLEAMFTKPCEVFLQRQLGVYFNEAQQEDEDSEPFELSALENWHLKQQALEQRLTRPEQRAEFMAQRAASGLLPVFEAGQLALQKADESVASLSLMLQCLQPDRASLNSKEELRLDLGQHGLFGALSKAHRGIRYYAKPGQLKGRDLMRAWLRHLFANACHPDAGEMWALDSEVGLVFLSVPQAQARQLLLDLLRLYQQGLTQPLPFFVQSAFKWFELTQAGKSDSDIAQGLQRVWLPGFGDIPGEGQDPYIARCYPDIAAVMAPFQALCAQLVVPMQEFIALFEQGKKQVQPVKHSVLLERLASMGNIQGSAHE